MPLKWQKRINEISYSESRIWENRIPRKLGFYPPSIGSTNNEFLHFFHQTLKPTSKWQDFLSCSFCIYLIPDLIPSIGYFLLWNRRRTCCFSNFICPRQLNFEIKAVWFKLTYIYECFYYLSPSTCNNNCKYHSNIFYYSFASIRKQRGIHSWYLEIVTSLFYSGHQCSRNPGKVLKYFFPLTESMASNFPVVAYWYSAV